eukprot:gene4137-2979_t
MVMPIVQEGSWIDGFISSFSMILVSEIGDKTFFIAALMAMRYNRLTVYAGALGALAVMTILSAAMGLVLPSLLSVRLTKMLSAILFFFFGFKILYEVYAGQEEEAESDERAEAEEALRQRELQETSGGQSLFCLNSVVVEAFSLTFLAEWGDRSQIATIALAAAKDPFAVTTGGILGHAVCTGLAVIGGGMIAQRVSMRSVNIIGGSLFLIFGIITFVGAVLMYKGHNGTKRDEGKNKNRRYVASCFIGHNYLFHMQARNMNATGTAADNPLGGDPSFTKDLQMKICFNVCRKELYHPNKGYKHLARKLRQNATIDVNKEDVTLDRLMNYDIAVFAAPQQQLSPDDITAIQEYVAQGGSALLLFGDGHGGHYSYLNKVLDEWTGTTLNEDCVIRTVLHKYLHPKEVCVTNGVVNRAINKAAGKTVPGAVAGYQAPSAGGLGRGPMTTLSRTALGGGATKLGQTTMMQQMQSMHEEEPEEEASSVVFVYPNGLTFNTNRPGIPILSSGFMAYPLNRPIAVVWESPTVVEHMGRKKQGKLMMIGSAQIFEDSWISKEENEKLTTVLFDYLNHKLRLNQIDADEPDVSDYHYLPDTASLSERLRVAVEQQADLPRDFTKLFSLETFKLDTDKIPDVIDTYEKLGVKLEPLTLIPPEFQTPLPPVKPAVFGPIHRDPMPPALDLYDLDEEFAPERVRLNQLTNKCKPEDVEFYILQAAEVMGVTKKLRSPRNRDPRALLDYIFRQVVQYKKVNAGPAQRATSSGPPMSRPDSSNAAAAAAARGMTRIIRVDSTNSLAGVPCDVTPFFDNQRWTLLLEADFGAGTIMGSLRLLDSSDRFGAQEVRVEGDIKPPGEREYPIEWGVVLDAGNGEQVLYLFMAMIQGNQLRGVCEQGGTENSNTRNFLYNIEEL